MLKPFLAAALAATAAALLVPAPAHAEGNQTVTQTAAAPTVPTQSGRREINGVNYYYEIHGQGEPLLVLHGGLGSVDMFGPVLPILTEGRQVILVDQHGHGRTPLGNRAINPADIGADMAELIGALGHDRVDVLGYSFGAWNALHLAAHAPQRVRRLVLVSAPFAREGFFPEMLPQQAQLSAAMADAMRETPMYQSYAAVAPNPGEFPRLLDEMGRLMREPYDYTAAVRRLTMPVMLIFGDSDMVRPEHIVQFYQMLGGGRRDAGWQREHMSGNRLAILPDLTHYEAFMAPQVFRTALPFLNGQSGARSWAETVGGE